MTPAPPPNDPRYGVRSANRQRRYDAVADDSIEQIRNMAADAADAADVLWTAIARLRTSTSQRYAAQRLGLSPKELRVIEERGYTTPAKARAIAEHLGAGEPPATG